MSAETIVRARIDSVTKARATKALASMGMSVSDAIRMLMVRVAADKALPFKLSAPNATTRKAMRELERKKGRRFETAEQLFDDLDI